MKKYISLLLALLILLVACETPGWGHMPTIPPTATDTPTLDLEPTATPSATLTPTETLKNGATAVPPTYTPAMRPWKTMPVVPVISEKMIEVYRLGLAAGHDPTHFSKIGDCQNIVTYFLADFDHPNLYDLGSTYANLQPTIDYFSGSWSRKSLAVKGGMNVAAMMNPFWADSTQCQPSETPLACEIRHYNPSIVTVSMEESWSGDMVKYNMYLRQVVEYILSQNIVPILATRADNFSEGESVDPIVAKVAYDYQVPLWNFWAATYLLPSHGLTADGFHLTQGGSLFDFGDPTLLKTGWTQRNLTALQAIDAVWHALNGGQ